MSARAEPLLRLTDLAVAPPDARDPVVRGIDLAVESGECVALVGASGAGKTTLLKTIGRQIEPRAGTIMLAGSDITTLKGRALRVMRHQIGYVAQKLDLVEPLRVHQNVTAGALGRWSTARALRYLVLPMEAELTAARGALTAVGLEQKLMKPTAALSGGEQQRVAIARALIQSPRLLLADEPVASLDPWNARQILELLTRLAVERGMALLCSLHQPELAQRYFDRVVEVSGGAIVCGEGARGQAQLRAVSTGVRQETT